MIVKVRCVASGEEWALTEDGDPLNVEAYIDAVRAWGTSHQPSRTQVAGNVKGDASGEFRVTSGQGAVEFVIDLDFE